MARDAALTQHPGRAYMDDGEDQLVIDEEWRKLRGEVADMQMGAERMLDRLYNVGSPRS